MNSRGTEIKRSPTWPLHLYPAINHAKIKSRRDTLTSEKSLNIVPTEHRSAKSWTNRPKTLTCSQDSRVLRIINDIIDLIEGNASSVNRIKPNNIDQRNDDKNATSNLSSLLTTRLQEIEALRLNKHATKSLQDEKCTKLKHAPSDLHRLKTCDTLEVSHSDSDGPYLDDHEFDIMITTPSTYSTLSKRPVLNIAHAKLDVPLIKEAAKRLRWDVCESNISGDIFWFANCLTEATIKEHCKSLFGITYNKVSLNRFPDIQGGARKTLFACLTHIYEKYTKDDPYLYSPANCPKTYVFPRGYESVTRMLKSDIPMILKPSAGSMGSGIKVITNPEQIPQAVAHGSNYVCQVYIDRPMLLEGCKFDFRIYVLITNIGGGFRALLSTLGIARKCTQPYQRPDKENCHDPYVHLTNYSINRHNSQFRRSKYAGDSVGNKRTLHSVLETLKSTHGVDTKKIWKQITSLSEAAISIIYPIIQINADVTDAYSFQIMGLDMLLDECGKMWLLEVNANPSLQYMYTTNDSTKTDFVDYHIKVTLVEECLKLVHRMRCGYPSTNEMTKWIELKIRIPPEIGEVTALYTEYRKKYQQDDIECDDLIRFFKHNGLLTPIKNGIMKQNNSVRSIVKHRFQDVKDAVKNSFLRNHTQYSVKGFPEFLKCIEALASYTFYNVGNRFSKEMVGKSERKSNNDIRKELYNHHKATEASCLCWLMDHLQFFKDFRD